MGPGSRLQSPNGSGRMAGRQVRDDKDFRYSRPVVTLSNTADKSARYHKFVKASPRVRPI
ncbi:MAG: hypothetical protein A2826_01170 [Candidatus Doudnabacteria bacterium RIFCSPHIGHO2_01_FULL_43_23]|uniref:Uncharacterized protein n=1 Tax=Candidatus Doudnabacteria bacterium RIFCSPHIGHO2_01_FULL_43_23 TaxID=1817822 RepID=A0A1F5NSS7_9BACT|nr:MAG: hypothetical protein A2826_01170 [Candidatus Doudnabacteria bacterium RIFCSPHIGHO2_01_FULL_43_23]